MAPKAASAALTFGARLLQLLGDRKVADVERATGIPRWTLDRWKNRDTPPQKSKRAQIRMLEQYLGGRLLNDDWTVCTDPIREKVSGEMREPRIPYGEEPARRRVIIQPLDFKKEALDANGRALHYLSKLRKHLKAKDATGAQLMALVERARREIADAQSHLMEEIDVNDLGEKM